MLVLTRKKGERVMIGDDIVITLIDVRGDGVRIGFHAPRGVTIQRAEVVAAVTAANTGAAVSASGSADLLVDLLNRARSGDAPAAPLPSAQEAAVAAPGEASRPPRRRIPPKPAPPRPQP